MFTSLGPPSKKCRAWEVVRHSWDLNWTNIHLGFQRFLSGNPSFSGCKFQVLGDACGLKGSPTSDPLMLSSMVHVVYILHKTLRCFWNWCLANCHDWFLSQAATQTGSMAFWWIPHLQLVCVEKWNLDPLLGERLVSKSIYLSHLCDSKGWMQHQKGVTVSYSLMNLAVHVDCGFPGTVK